MEKTDYSNIPDWTLHFDRAKDAWLALSVDGTVRQFNPLVPPLLGVTPSRLAGKKLSKLLKRADSTVPRSDAVFRGMLFVLQSGRKAGAIIALEEMPCALPNWHGRLLRLADVTELIEAETGRTRKLDRLTALADIMTLAESDRQRWLDEAMELGARTLGLELGMTSRIHDDTFVLLAHNAPGILQYGQMWPLGQTYCSITVLTHDVQALSPFKDSEWGKHPCYQVFGYQSYIGAPLWVHGELYGTVSFCSKVLRPDGFDHNDKVFVKLLARWIGGVIERMNVEGRLRESHGELEEQVELLAMAEKVARLGHWRLDMQLRTLLLSEEAQGFLGLPTRPDWGLGEFEALIAADDRGAWRDQINACARDGAQIGLELRMINADGYTRWLSLRGMRLEQHDQHQLFGVMLDITDTKQAQETILFQASHDSLTGLINRVLLFDRLGQEIRRCQRSDGHFAVLFIDLDYFKQINDRYGHEAGDRVLVQVAKRLVAALRKSDTVGRFGGDEFIAIVPGLNSGETAALLVRKILRRLEAPILFGRDELFISASIGISYYPSDAALPQDLIRKADNDMYRVKESRRGLPNPLSAGKRRSGR
ncbi:MAG: sensor domain-containing diguanylate cyclase [Paludibacterium sp.]|uniref:sensor domain-containing diguanylate cyclase n=1 Tax=Paludibacterium sp. TaxID=1917523 RepID=UPI0025F78911|nr:sensor domain-containing diguanylate cyclase [Paludibacterium sp.]MBV8045851.1 sensor domain-containing diguanylate cyclase [Paludibacterium sp.]MBV8646789.1 sensor domain-containing diguanylate cyclase [Paludibacterium sp.]